jgi:hypothetical protein
MGAFDPERNFRAKTLFLIDDCTVVGRRTRYCIDYTVSWKFI